MQEEILIRFKDLYLNGINNMRKQVWQFKGTSDDAASKILDELDHIEKAINVI